MKILLIEDEKITRIALTNTLRKKGYEVNNSETGAYALTLLEANSFDVVVTDLRLPDISGLEILKKVKDTYSDTQVIVMTAYATVDTAIEALKHHAYDYITKPFSPDRLLTMLEKISHMKLILDENKTLKAKLTEKKSNKLIGDSKAMLELNKTIDAVAKSKYSVLITGESGTGKEIVSKNIHYRSERFDQEFIAVNCAAIPETLIESELFGHEKGAFTGADKQHIGYFERANNGTILLDEIDDFPLHLQVKLLRFLQERELVRVGGKDTIKINVRVVSATKVDLKKLVEKRLFREDLYYRLNIIPIHLPSLRKRKDDIPLLIEHFLKKNKNKLTLGEGELEKFNSYDWPGNVRELENSVERMVALKDLYKSPSEVMNSFLNKESQIPQDEQVIENDYPFYQEYIEEKDREILLWAMEKADHNLSEASRLLNLARSTLQSKLNKYMIS